MTASGGISNYVPSVTFDTCDDLNVVRSAGEAFGDFQLMLGRFRRELALFYTIPDFHDTRKRYEKLKADAAADPCRSRGSRCAKSSIGCFP